MGRKHTGARPRGESSIEISFYYQGKRFYETLKMPPTPANMRQASLLRAQIIQAIDEGSFEYEKVFPRSKNIKKVEKEELNERTFTIEKMMTMWLEHREHTLKHSTFVNYRKIINYHIIPNLGHIPINKLRRVDVLDWVSKLDVSNKRIANLISPLRAALKDAVQNDLIETNPLYDWAYKKLEGPKASEIDPFSQREREAILRCSEGQNYNLIDFAFWTGLRTSELVALEWRDIDFKKEVIHVQRAFTQQSKKVETTKTSSGIRYVKILPPALNALRDQWKYTGHSNRVFNNPNTDEPWTGDQAIRRMWVAALNRARVRYRYPYQTRHTYASMMLSAGEPLAWVSHQMGHSTVTITARVYAKWIPDSDPEVGMRAVTMFGGNSAVTSGANLEAANEDGAPQELLHGLSFNNPDDED